jgi:hypothetical protein
LVWGGVVSHDKLLATIENKFNNQSNLHNAQIVNALYRVVELHKSQSSTFDDDECAACSNAELSIVYPCETIKVIEKELA